MEHYYTSNPKSEEDIQSFEWEAAGQAFTFYTNAGVFSRKQVDFGSMLLINTILNEKERLLGNLLDIGCGYGPIGIIIAKAFSDMQVTMADINERAVKMAGKNIIANNINNAVVIQSDGFKNIDGKFHIITTNPPIRAGKAVIYKMFSDAYDHLLENGQLYIVIQKKQGSESSLKELKKIFGNCIVINKKSGYNILYCKKS